ncbi:MAG: ABC transporter ATP-binding protein [Actinobacteria bacterium]|nr:MAG: ABC transporter ATP-binding protein [Actinomycetota bacterium]
MFVTKNSASEKGLAAQVKDVSKSFRLYRDRSRSFKEAALRRQKKRSFEEFWALKNVSFDVNEGESFGIIGENGSGKSTLLKILTKVYTPTSGSIQTMGKISGLLELGAGFHPELTGRENVYLNGSILGMKRKQIDMMFDEIVEFAELEKFIDTPVKHYSSGMFIRLGFAVAINVDPDILVIDEVLAVGDEHFQHRCNQKILEFKKSNKTIIIVSHALEEMRNLCDRILWLDNGKPQELGKAAKVVDAYLDSINKQEEESAEHKAEKIGKYGRRWGSKEAEITGVEFFDQDGKKKSRFKTTDSLRARIYYKCHQEIDKPVFGVAIHRQDGAHITGPNTKVADIKIDKIKGEGYVDYTVKSLPLLKGGYLFSAAIYDHSCLHPYDHHDEMYFFEIESGVIKEGFGIVHIPASWSIK